MIGSSPWRKPSLQCVRDRSVERECSRSGRSTKLQTRRTSRSHGALRASRSHAG